MYRPPHATIPAQFSSHALWIHSVFLFALLAAAISGLLLKSLSTGRAKSAESGDEAKEAADVSEDLERTLRFYIVAVLVVICDAALIVLLPWAVKFESLGVYGFSAISVFLGILVVGYLWIRKKGALDSI
jgi:NADH-quinone oxidoreductase subunit A